jgi:hypothetical protein
LCPPAGDDAVEVLRPLRVGGTAAGQQQSRQNQAESTGAPHERNPSQTAAQLRWRRHFGWNRVDHFLSMARSRPIDKNQRPPQVDYQDGLDHDDPEHPRKWRAIVPE